MAVRRQDLPYESMRFETINELHETDAGANLSVLDGSVLGIATASSTLVLDSNKRATKVAITEITTVDASAGGVAQTTSCTLVPAGSIILSVNAIVGTAFDGDTTTTLEVGVSGNIDAYIDTSDFDPSATAGTAASNIGGSNNDVKGTQYNAAAVQVITTWTNTASASAGSVDVAVTFVTP